MPEKKITKYVDLVAALVPFKVTVVAFLQPDQVVDGDWHVVERDDGYRFRLEFDGTQTPEDILAADALVKLAELKFDESKLRTVADLVKQMNQLGASDSKFFGRLDRVIAAYLIRKDSELQALLARWQILLKVKEVRVL